LQKIELTEAERELLMGADFQIGGGANKIKSNQDGTGSEEIATPTGASNIRGRIKRR
jgi:hypothetical protein